MGTMTITQAGKTYRCIQSNNGLRVEFENPDGSTTEVLRHWPDSEPVNTAPTYPDTNLTFDVEAKA